jgi:hypothetical protein
METRLVQADNLRPILEEYGIDILTGEADGTGMRVLVDLDDNGQALLREALGGAEFLNPGWNNYNGKCAMLFREMLRPLAIYALLTKADAVISVQHRDAVIYSDYLKAYYNLPRREDGFIDWQTPEWAEERERYNRVHEGHWRIIDKSGTAAGGLRNRHAFSGRVE